jgi:hypothetical protein
MDYKKWETNLFSPPNTIVGQWHYESMYILQPKEDSQCFYVNLHKKSIVLKPISVAIGHFLMLALIGSSSRDIPPLFNIDS